MAGFAWRIRYVSTRHVPAILEGSRPVISVCWEPIAGSGNRGNLGSMRICVTGGAGFIGSALVRRLILHSDHYVGVLDKLTYASSLESLKAVSNSSRYRFEQVDICVASEVSAAIKSLDPDVIVHLAAETHVDRSIVTP